jgi:hypothetical protein
VISPDRPVSRIVATHAPSGDHRSGTVGR